MTLEETLQQAVWVAHTLFALGKTTGTTGNLSFRCKDEIYLTRSGGCFGTLTEADFSVLDLQGKLLRGPKPSKEAPLHLLCYRRSAETRAVIHTHGRYGVLWSALPGLNAADCLPPVTPYLRMKLGRVPLIPYAQPGSAELFRLVEEHLGDAQGCLLQRHGALVCGPSLMDAFSGIEELEETACVAWNLRLAGVDTIL